jgi:hypothetical protein
MSTYASVNDSILGFVMVSLNILRASLINLLTVNGSETDDEPTAHDSNLKLMKRFCLKSVAWIGIYMLSYYGFSIAWLLIPLLLTLFHQRNVLKLRQVKENSLSSAREAVLTNEKSMIEARIKVEDLPSWVFFPDKVGNYICVIDIAIKVIA